MTTLADYRKIFGARYTDAQLEALRARLRAVARATIESYRRQRRKSE